MNIKKILTAATASVLAVTAMSAVASADAVYTTSSPSWDGPVVDVEGLSADELSSITKVEAYVTSTGKTLQGLIGYNNKGNWKSDGKESSVEDGTVSAVWTTEDAAGEFTNTDADGNVGAYIQVQIGSVDEGASANVEAIVLYAGDKVVKTVGTVPSADTPPAEDESKPADDTTSADDSTSTDASTGTTTDDKKDNVDTGVAGVAAVVGVAVVAAGAMVVAKKRK